MKGREKIFWRAEKWVSRAVIFLSLFLQPYAFDDTHAEQKWRTRKLIFFDSHKSSDFSLFSLFPSSPIFWQISITSSHSRASLFPCRVKTRKTLEGETRERRRTLFEPSSEKWWMAREGGGFLYLPKPQSDPKNILLDTWLNISTLWIQQALASQSQHFLEEFSAQHNWPP